MKRRRHMRGLWRRRGLALAATLAGLAGCASQDGTPADPPSAVAEGPSSTTTTTSLLSRPRQTDVALAYETGSVVMTEAGAWVFPHLDAVALRIDRAGKVVEEVELAAYATAAAAGDGMLWARTEDDGQSYTRLDPSTGAVMGRVTDVPGDWPVVAHGFLWAVGSDGTLFRVDGPASRVDRFKVQSQGPFLLAATRTRVWTTGDHYDQHVWIWSHNPDGVFATWNPAITCD